MLVGSVVDVAREGVTVCNKLLVVVGFISSTIAILQFASRSTPCVKLSNCFEPFTYSLHTVVTKSDVDALDPTKMYL